ncbi:MAG: metalloregulator ArsR/SmtB family transcription factor [Actinomycetota bacterium]
MVQDRCELLCLDLPRAEDLRRRRMGYPAAQRAAERAQALGNPTGLSIAAALEAGDQLCVCDLSWVMERATNLVSHHLRQLRTAGLVGSRGEGKLILYSLTAEGRALPAATLRAEMTG